MKTLTNEEVIFIIENCSACSGSVICENCPLVTECLHYYTGENCGSCLETQSET